VRAATPSDWHVCKQCCRHKKCLIALYEHVTCVAMLVFLCPCLSLFHPYVAQPGACACMPAAPWRRYAKTVGKETRSSWLEFTQQYFLKREALVAVLLLVDASISPQKVDLDCARWLAEAQVGAVAGEHSAHVHYCLVLLRYCANLTTFATHIVYAQIIHIC
jgi:hypothetical protein